LEFQCFLLELFSIHPGQSHPEEETTLRGPEDDLGQFPVQAVGLFEAKFAPYPYDSLSVVETESPDGQEYDGLVFLSSDFYDQYGGSNRSNMVSIGVHEIAHNWWFGLVGNDQALEPWLDEALSVYSERIFYEFTNPNYGDWWWNFRVNYFNPSGWVDTSIYEGGTFRAYTNAAYLTGANFSKNCVCALADGVSTIS